MKKVTVILIELFAILCLYTYQDPTATPAKTSVSTTNMMNASIQAEAKSERDDTFTKEAEKRLKEALEKEEKARKEEHEKQKQEEERKAAEAKQAEMEQRAEEEEKEEEFHWDGEVLNTFNGVANGPSGYETYYNLPMGGVVDMMRGMGYDEENYPYWVRDDGAKMLGDYVMVAANLDVRPYGTILPCSLGMAIVCDTGSFAQSNPTQLDVAVSW